MSNHGLTADNMMQQFPIALQKTLRRWLWDRP